MQSMISSNPGFIAMVTYKFCTHLSQYGCLTALEKPGAVWPLEWDFDPRPLDCEADNLVSTTYLNPLTPKSNEHLNSPHHITPELNINVRRIEELIIN